MKYFKSKSTGTIFEVIHRGDDYIFGKTKDKTDEFHNTAQLYSGEWEEWTDEPKVGDKVKVKGKDMPPHTLLYIHQEKGDIRKYGVIAYHGDIPHSYRYETLEKVE